MQTRSLVILGGPAGNLFNVLGTPAGIVTTLDTGNGSDSLQVGSLDGSFAIGGNLSVAQGDGNEDQLNVDDNGTGSLIGGWLSVNQGNGNADTIQVMGEASDGLNCPALLQILT